VEKNKTGSAGILAPILLPRLMGNCSKRSKTKNFEKLRVKKYMNTTSLFPHQTTPHKIRPCKLVKGGEMKIKLTIIGVIAILLFVFSISASADLFPLIYEFDGTLPVQNYGTVEVTESGGALDFLIEYNTDTLPLGLNADIHEFYFNLKTILLACQIVQIHIL
jgi:hypothetical protein